jgi:MYXO-CTERM domain-containing protein
MAVSAGPAAAGLEYFAVNDGANDADIRVFSYDTVAKAVSLVDTVTLTGNNTANAKMVSAGTDLSFWAGGSGGAGSTGEGVERFSPNAPATAWSSDVYVKMNGETGASEYYDSNVRGAVNSDTVGPGGAELADGTILFADVRSDTYAVGDATGQSGTVTAVFTADAQHMGNLNTTLGGVGQGENPADVASTVAGSAGRFAVTGGARDLNVMVYNADGTFRGNLTNLSGGSNSAVGSMKTPGMGDVILQLDANRSTSPTIRVCGRSVAEPTFDTLLVPQFTVPIPTTGAYFIEATDVDGTQSGLIMVVGEARGGGTGDSPAVQFFDTAGNPTTPNPFRLEDIDPTLNSTDPRGAALFEVEETGAPIPEPAPVGLLGLALLATRRRRN